jgi:hypothetical protein
MPKTAINYENTIIYKIVCKDVSITDCYIGHTTDFIRRKQNHKVSCNNLLDKHYNLKVYKYIRENGGWDNFEMLVIEKYQCSDVYEAKIRERYWIETLKSNLNTVIPTRTNEEYRNTHKEQKSINDKKYREKNVEKLKVKHKEYYENKKTSIQEYKKSYYEKNKEEIKEKRKALYEKNKNNIQAYKKIVNVCDCGGHYTNNHKLRHFKSIIHQNFLKQQNSNNI